ncbi:MAG: NAD(+)/NADH kinase [Verrucomicrobiae bacterium]|nr:NAD(+)/NADH kinase [Verrucomicrobiae bacterium]
MKRKPPKIIGVAANLDKPQAAERLAALIRLLQSHKARVLQEHPQKMPIRRLAARSDMLMVLGGDGTILRVARELEGLPTPILGINLGYLGFLTAVSGDDWENATIGVLQGAYQISPRHTLQATLRRNRRRLQSHHALNDAVISRAASSRVVRLRVFVDEEWLTEYVCDGIIFATATGSTAYSLSAGGPILMPGARACLLTPICPHVLSNRPVITEARSVVRCQVAAAAGELLLTVDGQVQVAMQVGDELEVRAGSRVVYLVAPEGHRYFEVLRQKLKWSGSHVEASKTGQLG